MSTSTEARLGVWTDYSRGWFDRNQILATDFLAQFLTAFVAVWLTLAGPATFKIVVRFLNWVTIIWPPKRRPSQPADGPQGEEEAQPLLESTGTVTYSTVVQAGSTPDAENTTVAIAIPPASLDSTSPEDIRNTTAEAVVARPVNLDSISTEETRGSGATQTAEQRAPAPSEIRSQAEVGDHVATQTPDRPASDNDLDLPELNQEASRRSEDNNHTSRAPFPTSPSSRNDYAAEVTTAPRATEVTVTTTASKKLLEGESGRVMFGEFLGYEITGKANLTQTLLMILILMIVFGFFVAITIAGIFSSKIASDRVALSASENCGIWEFDENAGSEAGYLADLHYHEEEAEAGQYAQNCYTSSESANSLSCNFFYNQSIAFTSESQQACPFRSADLCGIGLYSAVVFDTGYIDASIIGINAAKPHKFRRTTSCAPLNMAETYVRNTSTNAPARTSFQYYYGQTDRNNFTFNTTGNHFEWLIPAYSINTYFSSLYPDSDYWHPLPDLLPARGSTLSIFFVSSMHIYHTKASFDPIFPATKVRHVEGYKDPYYYNSDPRAQVFACADTSELCSPDGNTCWSMTATPPPDSAVDPAYWLMKWALESSTTYDSIVLRLGSALLAQQSVSQSISNPLGNNHWELEASRLFATSLARIQYDAWKIATVRDRELPGYVEITPDEARGQLCGLFKFKNTDYTNINLLAMIFIPLLAVGIMISSMDAGFAGLIKMDEADSKDRLVIGYIIGKIGKIATIFWTRKLSRFDQN